MSFPSMSTFDPSLKSTRQSNRRGGQAIVNPLLRIEGEILSYAELGARFRLSEQDIRTAVRRARGLKAGLTWDTLKFVLKSA